MIFIRSYFSLIFSCIQKIDMTATVPIV